MNSSPLVSIIVPAYNAARFIDRCIGSLVAQTLQDIEIIAVDDGSTDDTPALLDGWAERDHRIRVVHQSNGGLSAARNAGLDMVSAPYVAFVDSDDYVEHDMYEVLYHLIQHRHTDISMCGAWLEPYEAPESRTVLYPQGLREDTDYSPHDLLMELVYHKRMGNYVWCMLYRTELWSEVRFPVGKWYEDIAVQHQLIQRATKGITYTSRPLYHYIMHGGNCVTNTTPQRLQHYVDALIERLDYVQHSTLFTDRERALLQTAIIKDTLRPCRQIHKCGDSEWLRMVRSRQRQALLIPIPRHFVYINILSRMMIALNYMWIRVRHH